MLLIAEVQLRVGLYAVFKIDYSKNHKTLEKRNKQSGSNGSNTSHATPPLCFPSQPCECDICSGVQGPLAPVPQPNMVASGMSPQSTAGFVPGINVQHPNYTGVQTFTGQPMMYNNSQ